MPCAELSIRRQCELVGISRSGFYYEPVVETPENLVLMRRLDELHLEHLVYGSRRLRALLQREGREVNRKRVVRLLQLMVLLRQTCVTPREAAASIGSRLWRRPQRFFSVPHHPNSTA